MVNGRDGDMAEGAGTERGRNQNNRDMSTDEYFLFRY